ncbi:MAG TPA: hypothetical protein VG456_06565 [Candidatus Sulfopaludibacter sp.]|jgi:hypothetical protein|nr:hypothetical protein [Candidatus Sulfopaludibacter sp.]
MPDYPKTIARTAFTKQQEESGRRKRGALKVQRSKAQLSSQNEVDVKTCGVLYLKVTSQKTGVAFGGASLDRTSPAQDLVPGATERFCFAPDVETLLVEWKFRHPELITSATLALYRDQGGSAERLWAKEIQWDKDACPEIVQTTFNGNLSSTAAPATANDVSQGGVTAASTVKIKRECSSDEFPDKYVTIEHSPYQLRISITKALVHRSPQSQWLFLDVDCKLDLAWGQEEMIPKVWVDGALGRELDKVRAEEVKILNDFRAAAGGTFPIGAGNHEVVIDTNVFKEGQEAYHRDFEETTKLWGQGPRLPILANILIKQSDGQFVKAPLGIGNTRFLWNWEDQAGTNATPKWEAWDPAAINPTKDFLRAVVDEYKDATDPHESDNCPVELGGKRQKDGADTLPAQNGYDAVPAVQDGEFPFPVATCANRKWAAFSKAWRTGALAGTTGVLFQPSRIAGDKYKLTVCLHYDRRQDDPALQAALLRTNAGPDAHAVSGFFEVFRRVEVHYIKRDPTQAALNMAGIQTLYKNEAGIIIKLNTPAFNEAVYKRHVRAAADAEGRDFNSCNTYKILPLFLRYGLINPQPDASPAIALNDVATFRQNVENAFKNNAAYRLEIPNPGDFCLEEVHSGGAQGIVVEKDATSLFVLSTNATDFQEGQPLQGLASGGAATIGKVRTSCWEKNIVPAVMTTEKRVNVKAGGNTSAAKFGMFSSSMTETDKTAVYNFLSREAAANAKSAVFIITLEAKQTGNARNNQRYVNVRDYVQSLFADQKIFERKALLARVNAIDRYSHFTYVHGRQPELSHGYPNLINSFLEKVFAGYVDELFPHDRGIFFFHVPGRDSLFNVQSTGASFPTPSKRTRALVYVGIWPNAHVLTARLDGSAIVYKNNDSVAAHEMGHALFLPHAIELVADGRRPGSPIEPAQHVISGTCIMNYDHDSDHFCGFCMLRLRGWDWAPIRNEILFGVTNLAVVAGPVRSRTNYGAIATGPRTFCFAPQLENTTLSYKIHDPGKRINACRIELTRQSDGLLLHTWFLTAKGYTHGSHDTLKWDGSIPVTPDFPDGFITLEHSPYKLEIKVSGRGVGDPSSAWTEFGVDLEKLEVVWGPASVLANSPALYNTGVQRDLHLYNKLAVADDPDNLGNAVPATGELKKVYLLCNYFNTAEAEKLDNTAYDRHLQAWGFGPHIPLFVDALIKRSDGTSVCDGVALGNAKFLWDWNDTAKPPDPGLFPHDLLYLTEAYNYKPVALADYPNGNNCHEDRGGKRGANHPHPIFPPQAGTGPGALVANQFPFAVQAGANRTWAAISLPWRSGDAAANGKSGVIFNPSRMAGDAYQVTVCLYYARHGDPDQTGVPYTGVYNGLPAEYKTETGDFEIWKEVEIVKHIQKSGDLGGRPAATQDGFDTYYQPTFVQVRKAPLETADRVAFNNAFQASVAAAPVFIQHSINPAVDQWAAGPHGVHFRPHAEYQPLILPIHIVPGFAPVPNDIFNNQPLWAMTMATSQGDYEGALSLNWPRMLAIGVLEHYVAPMQDGAMILEVNMLWECRGNAGGPRGFAVHFWAPVPNTAALLLCSDSPPETAAHELGHLLFLNHVHAQQGDRPRLHNHHAKGAGCVMSYVKTAREFCGPCMLRLRGWSLFEVNNATTGAYGAQRTLWPEATHNRHPVLGGVVPALPPLNPVY